MRIGFDAKRVFLNRSGLGNYSRDIIRSLLKDYPESEYLLYSPRTSSELWDVEKEGGKVICPPASWGKIRQAWWRSLGLTAQLRRDEVSLFHGLSNELPKKIERSGIKSIVTIHDLIFLRHPEWYPLIDRNIYKKKFRHAACVADRVVAISQQTKSDLIEFFGIPEEKIELIYQGCYKGFYQMVNQAEKEKARKQWKLPEEYLLYVGTVEERKNLLTLVKAIQQQGISMHLVVVGRPTTYMKEVQQYIQQKGMQHIHFLKEVAVSDLPAIYQMARVFVYPSVFEGFGIPVLEALLSGVPVITSKGGCFSEVGGPDSVYIDPANPEELGTELKGLLADSARQQQMIEAGKVYARRFSNETIASQLMNLYKSVINER